MSETIHNTRGIVLKCIKYGDTSIITTIYTELFGIQTYIVKGVRKQSKKGSNNASYFLPASILDLQVYHNEQKQIQFIKEFQWSFLYTNIPYDIVKNAVAMFSIELLQHSIKQPESNPELFYFIENSFILLDKSEATATANFPLLFLLKLGNLLGFGIEGNYTPQTPILDLQEGSYCTQPPLHPYFIDGVFSSVTTDIINLTEFEQLSNLKLNRTSRRQLIEYYIQYFTLHISNFIDLKSLDILKIVLE